MDTILRETDKAVQNRKNLLFYLCNIMVPLVLGFILYVIFRRDTYISKFVCRYIDIKRFDTDEIPSSFATKFIRYYACDILWAYSLTFVCYWFSFGKNRYMFSIILCGCFEILIEMLQRFHLFPGTFDFWDILFEFITTLVALWIIKHKSEIQGGQYYEKKS